MSEDDPSLTPPAEKPKRVQHKPTALELAAIAAAIDPKLTIDNPSKAVHLAEKLVRAAQARIDCPFNDQEEETEEEACERHARESLFKNELSVSEAFEKWGLANGYKTERGFAAALREAGLSYETLDIKGPSVVEMTSESAVNKFRGWKKERERKSNRESKNKSRSEISQKNTGTLEIQKGTAEANNGKSNGKTGSNRSKKRTGPRSR